MPEIQKKSILDVLKTIIPTSQATNIVDSGIVSAVIIDSSQVGIVLDFGDTPPNDAPALRALAEEKAKTVPGVTAVNVVMSAIKKAPTVTPATKAPPTPTQIPGVKHVIAVASGKGGVGKSTTSINLALALQKYGLKVGLLDADIFGPSVPMLTGLTARPEIKDKVIQPLIAFDMKVMSIGFLIDVDQPVVWRGPRVMGATQQLLKDVAWGPLDVLVVDMPPGTGDVQLSMVQQAVLSGAIIVSTPQDLALIDARKGISMFQKVGTPILGIIENMSTYICPNCGTESHIFGHGGAQEVARTIGCPFLGAVPLHISLRETGDKGTPVTVSDKESPISQSYYKIAEKIAGTLGL
ncbi:Mrp/NBP35 family ATP-binding protein [Kordiimonas pumila]|uniref:Iron-sulfur cluster carrier protein n=1 Tax=Kordiimonas pumila TaxID=2161677 RepID=A0ABV7D920_9PROT|nr:Mrp/NBP35 family ATP-binding protein [Kordiimonas pumila]